MPTQPFSSGSHFLAHCRLRTVLAASLIAGLALSPASAVSTVQADHFPTAQGELLIQPLNHATFVMQGQGQTIYVDPVGASARFQGLPPPSLILITHEHADHLSAETLTALGAAPIVAPPTVRDQLPPALAERVTVMQNGDAQTVAGIAIKAVPAYNTTPERLKYHPKGRGNGYVLTTDGLQVYVAGDTEDIPEMRALQGIDIAFVPMNLPYTMTVQQAASAVRAFKPRVVYPYHYRGSDPGEFARLVGQDSDVEVRLRDWYRAD